MYWRGNQLAVPDPNTPYIYTTYDDAANIPYAVLGIIANQSQQWAIQSNNGAGSWINDTNSTTITTGPHDYLVTLITGNNAFNGYLDGSHEIVAQGLSPATTATSSFSIASFYSITTRVLNAITHMAAVWQRQLSAQEALWLHLDPYAMFVEEFWPGIDALGWIPRVIAAPGVVTDAETVTVLDTETATFITTQTDAETVTAADTQTASKLAFATDAETVTAADTQSATFIAFATDSEIVTALDTDSATFIAKVTDAETATALDSDVATFITQAIDAETVTAADTQTATVIPAAINLDAEIVGVSDLYLASVISAAIGIDKRDGVRKRKKKKQVDPFREERERRERIKQTIDEIIHPRPPEEPEATPVEAKPAPRLTPPLSLPSLDTPLVDYASLAKIELIDKLREQRIAELQVLEAARIKAEIEEEEDLEMILQELL
jgi:hypothetical protein